ncbi:protein UPSTREAM OF FLC isoform X2 [Cajanus cajan]|uniref:protein UPSTREAM OF FLC isoform X2 n=1 Tax=Cajanus cajan TaxID=3821 RepID=UPI0010FB37AB|nr:protein UPSTREAM OF FLC isoform X2 [Cajanus cajan]
MDVNIRGERGIQNRERSPERVRLKQKAKPSRKVQVVYYLSRNGLLEHPHFMEVTLLPNQPLRLKDVFDRLMGLRGSGMPLQYSWSSKRNYKSGYVWHDLSLKDVIHPAEGGEYVLKGSELVEGCSGSERYNNVRNRKKQGIDDEQAAFSVCKEEEEGEKRSWTTRTHSGGVWREDPEEEKKGRKVVKGEGVSSRYSVLLQLIACGSAGAELKGKQGTKEYFSGSLVESLKGTQKEEGEAVLNKSNSYNELRLGMEMEAEEEKGLKDKCIPLIKSPKHTTTSTK